MRDFEELGLNLAIKPEEIQASFTASNFFIESTTVTEGDLTILTITNIFTKTEIEMLRLLKPKGHSKNLKITVQDEAGISNIVKTQVALQFVHKKFLFWYVVYDKEVPTEALDITADQITINVGELGIPTQYYKRKKKVRYTLKVIRTFGDKSTKVELFQGAIKLY